MVPNMQKMRALPHIKLSDRGDQELLNGVKDIRIETLLMKLEVNTFMLSTCSHEEIYQ